MGVCSQADTMRRLDSDRLRLIGQAEVRRIDSVVKGDMIEYNQRTSDVKVRGDGLLMRDGTLIKSDSIDYNLDAETGELSTPDFWLGDSAGSGEAEYAEILSRDHMRREQGCCAGCAWQNDAGAAAA